MTSVLLVSAGLIHPPLPARYRLRRILQGGEGVRCEHIGSLAKLLRLSLNKYHAIALYYHWQRSGAGAAATAVSAAVDALEAFVDGGGGLLAVHSATASFKDAKSARYFDLLGGRFVGHGPVQRFRVQPCASRPDVFAGIPAFTITDELYLHELRDDIRPHFVAGHEGESAPVVWTREQGQGRVCYVGPGHRAATLRHPAMQAILQRGLAWAAGEGKLGAGG